MTKRDEEAEKRHVVDPVARRGQLSESTVENASGSRFVVDVVRRVASDDCTHESPDGKGTRLERCHCISSSCQTRRSGEAEWCGPSPVGVPL